ncbi:MAG: hypothetical protein ACC631_09780 [Halocynthiibacter sp.]
MNSTKYANARFVMEEIKKNKGAVTGHAEPSIEADQRPAKAPPCPLRFLSMVYFGDQAQARQSPFHEQEWYHADVAFPIGLVRPE